MLEDRDDMGELDESTWRARATSTRWPTSHQAATLSSTWRRSRATYSTSSPVRRGRHCFLQVLPLDSHAVRGLALISILFIIVHFGTASRSSSSAWDLSLT